MARLVLVLAIGAVIAASALIGTAHFVGLIVGLLAGAAFFLLGLAGGGGLPEASLSQGGQRRGDPNSGIGTALAAAGIACSVVGDTHFLLSFRIFYGVCVAAGIVIAVVIAWRSRARVS